MNRYLKFALPIALVCALSSIGLFALYVLVISMHSFAPTAQLPFYYFQKLNFPALAVLLPIVGMAALLPYALRLALAKETAATVTTKAQTLEASIETHYLKAA
jgi:hypothetical protein